MEGAEVISGGTAGDSRTFSIQERTVDAEWGRMYALTTLANTQVKGTSIWQNSAFMLQIARMLTGLKKPS